jgi:NAD(P)-dependent dehydrogenase (short-subunit alcohol dehydrogenase family)
MEKTLLVCGYGPGISSGVAERFGKEGFAVGLVARSADRLDAGVKALEAKGIRAAAFPTDLADPGAVAALVERVRPSLGPVRVIHWNAYAGGAADLLTADAASIRAVLDVPVTSLLSIVQAALPDLKKAEGAAVLITNGGFGKIDPRMDALGVQLNAMGLSLANAAKDKLAGLLHARLEADGVYVGQLMINGAVKGTRFDNGAATLDPHAIGDRFWSLYSSRTEVRAEMA